MQTHTFNINIHPYTTYNVSVRAKTAYPEWGPAKYKWIKTAESGKTGFFSKILHYFGVHKTSVYGFGKF